MTEEQKEQTAPAPDPAKSAGMIYELWPKVLKYVGPLAKDGWEKYNKYGYHSIEAISVAANAAFAEHGVSVETEQHDHAIIDSYMVVKKENGKEKVLLTPPMVIARVTIKFTAIDGSSIKSSAVGSSAMNNDKCLLQAAAMAFKFALKRALVIGEADEDPDAEQVPVEHVKNDTNHNAQSPRREERQPKQQDQGRPSGGKAGGGGGYPAMDSLFRLAGMFKYTGEELNALTRQALGLHQGERSPMLKDVESDENRIAIIKVFVNKAVSQRNAVDVASAWMIASGFGDKNKFFDACFKRKVTTEHFKSFIEAINQVRYYEPETEPGPPEFSQPSGGHDDDIPF